MIESIKYENFKILRDATLPLSPFTLIIGPNGSVKSTAINRAVMLARENISRWLSSDRITSSGMDEGSGDSR